MKIILLIAFVISLTTGQAQRRPLKASEAEHKRADSLELLFRDGCNCKIINDTLPLRVADEYDENNLWRQMKLVRYYFDDAKRLKKIDYRDGLKGDYSFYFDGLNLRKVRILKNGTSINIQFYFSDDENNYLIEDIEEIIRNDAEKRDMYTVLKMGKEFYEKSKSVL